MANKPGANEPFIVMNDGAGGQVASIYHRQHFGINHIRQWRLLTQPQLLSKTEYSIAGSKLSFPMRVLPP
jgi:hypothetical protein